MVPHSATLTVKSDEVVQASCSEDCRMTGNVPGCVRDAVSTSSVVGEIKNGG
jgi:hypothetical protein